MTALIDTLPGGLDLWFRPGNRISRTLSWPAGSLTARTFTATLDGAALGLNVAGDVMTVSATDAQTTAAGLGAHTFLLTETTGGISDDLIVGTWTGSTKPGSPADATLTVTLSADSVTVEIDAAAAIAASEAKRPKLTAMHAASDWTPFTAVPVTAAGAQQNTVTLTADTGRGIATGSVSGDGNDRRLYLLNKVAANVEIRAEVEHITGNPQIGFALRADEDQAVASWTSVIFGANAQVLQGVWEFNGTTLHNTNQLANVAYIQNEVISIAGNGTTSTCKTRYPHGLRVGDLVQFAGVGSFGQETVATVPDAVTFTFADPANGNFTGGTFRWQFVAPRRWIASRLVGDKFTCKTWLPGDPEPSWFDPLRAITNTLPATLGFSGGPPPTSGKVGLVIAHLGTTGQVRFNDLTVTVLD